jgi:hypothetical protein
MKKRAIKMKYVPTAEALGVSPLSADERKPEPISALSQLERSEIELLAIMGKTKEEVADEFKSQAN